MPIYEYACKSCHEQFELLVRGSTIPECQACGSRDLDKLLSLPRVKSESIRSQSMRAAKKRDAAQAQDRLHDRLQYEKSHDRHG